MASLQFPYSRILIVCYAIITTSVACSKPQADISNIRFYGADSGSPVDTSKRSYAVSHDDQGIPYPTDPGPIQVQGPAIVSNEKFFVVTNREVAAVGRTIFFTEESIPISPNHSLLISGTVNPPTTGIGLCLDGKPIASTTSDLSGLF